LLHAGRRPPSHRLRSKTAPLATLALLTVLFLGACGPTATNEDDRKFANQTQPPAATPVPAGSPIAGVPAGSAPPIAATPDLASLLSTSTPIGSAFFLVEGRLLIASSDGTVRDVSLPGPVSALSVSPGGDLAAVLVAPVAFGSTPASTPERPGTPGPSGGTESQRLSVVIVGSDGETLRLIDDLQLALDAQSDVRSVVSGDGAVTTVAIGPTADDLLVVFPDGLLVRLPAEGAAAVVPGSGNLADVRQVVWASDGAALAIVGADAPGAMPAVFSTALREDGIDPVRIAPAPGRTTGDIAWLPDGRGVLFVDTTGPVSTETLRSGRDLFLTPLRSDRRTLVAAAGIIGPAAGVVDFAVNPDGDSVAYTLYRVEGDGVRFNSLWVGSVDGRSPVQLTLPDGATVGGLAWTAAGLLVLTAATDAAESTVLLVGSDGVARPATAQPATPAA